MDMITKKMTKVRNSFAATCAVICLAGCATGAVTPRDAVQQSVETAPADLQLACASEAQQRISNGVAMLPIRSTLRDDDTFQIDLTSSTTGATCQITRSGVILALEPAAAIQQSAS